MLLSTLTPRKLVLVFNPTDGPENGRLANVERITSSAVLVDGQWFDENGHLLSGEDDTQICLPPSS